MYQPKTAIFAHHLVIMKLCRSILVLFLSNILCGHSQTCKDSFPIISWGGIAADKADTLGIFVEAMNGYVKDATDERWSGSAKSSYAAAIGSAVQPKHVVLPVPSVELGVNNLLVQNPLW